MDQIIKDQVNDQTVLGFPVHTLSIEESRERGLSPIGEVELAGGFGLSKLQDPRVRHALAKCQSAEAFVSELIRQGARLQLEPWQRDVLRSHFNKRIGHPGGGQNR